MKKNTFIKAIGIYYPRALSDIKKSKEHLQPIYEGLTNSFESIRMLKSKTDFGQIIIKLFYSENLFSKKESGLDFQEIIIEDSGIGFNDTEFERLETLNDDRKGFQNRGTGRVQLIHFFDRSEYSSIYADTNSKTGFKQINFVLSKNKEFLKNDAIILYKNTIDIEAVNIKTVLSLKTPLDADDLAFYKELKIDELKGKIISHYLVYFCENRDSLPDIKLQLVINGDVKKELNIKSTDIPTIDKQDDIIIPYCKISPDGKNIEETKNKEKLNLKAFKINKDQLSRNELKLTSKGEISKKEIKLENLKPDVHIDDNHYLFLISGDYINNKDGDIRGEINIPSKEDFKKQNGEIFYQDEEILLDDIQEKANRKIETMYDEILKHKEKKELEIEKLKKMFLLSSVSIKEAKIKIDDSEEEILEKVYKADAKLIAKKDVEIKKRIDALDNLIPGSKDFDQKFNYEIDELTKAIPLQNRTALTHYVARRKLVLDLFDKVLNKKLEVQQSGRAKNEELIHNLLFQQGADDPENSDLWLINEDFIYFKGSSNIELSNVEIKGEKLFKDTFSIEEEKYLKSLGENRKIKKPDILLFPDEGKCIIIELKAPDVNVSNYLTQIDKYAGLIRNYTQDKFQITTFYGYLLGESIEPRDVLGAVSSFEESYQFDYLYRPSIKVIGFEGRSNGSIYTEVIKYSTLLARANKRNEIFIKKIQP